MKDELTKGIEFDFISDSTFIYSGPDLYSPEKLKSYSETYSIIDSTIVIQKEENIGLEKYLITEISDSEIKLAQHSMCNGSFFYTLTRK